MEAASVFLRTLFDAVPDGHVLIWTGQNKQSEWIDLSDFEPNLARAIDKMEPRRMSHDIYFGLGIRPKQFGKFGRGGADDVSGIVGVWVDMDIAAPTHKKTNLPTSLEDVMAFIDELPIPPTIINYTGGGIHGYWLFREPWMFENAEERLAAKIFVERWQKTLAARASSKNWAVDATHDLARIFRVPDTRNMKYGSAEEPVFVKTILFEPTRRSEPSEFDRYLADLPEGPSPSVDKTMVNATFDDIDIVRGRFRWDKLMRLFENDPKIQQTWQRERKDFHSKGKDSSPSAYDFALCNYFIKAGWSDQEIVDALMLCRADRKEDPKYDRADYYAYSLAKCRASQGGDATMNEARQEIEAGLPIENPLGKLNSLFKFDPDVIAITGIYKQVGRKPTFVFETTRGKVEGVPSTAIQDPKALSQAFIDQKNVGIPLTTKFVADWSSIVVQIILKAVRDEGGFGQETTILGAATQWLQDYLINHPPVVTIPEATRQRTPFIAFGHIFLSSLHMKPWVSKTFGESDLTHQMLLVHLRAYGGEQVKLNVEALHGKTNRTVWRLPVNDWTRDVVHGILLEHIERHGAIPPTALAQGQELTPPTYTNGVSHDDDFGLIDLTPKESGWESIVATEEEAMSRPRSQDEGSGS